ncbi:Hypothetical_protein [Hexamita inflata]|uniref:Hypothetical_protein n=1 Tax=Hexamita inflata TaxID=28002 RepID=A0AA86PTA7_9EUKA|nr:Hypothetical protein HINF_LOCUS30818 [Hexamita inflata]
MRRTVLLEIAPTAAQTAGPTQEDSDGFQVHLVFRYKFKLSIRYRKLLRMPAPLYEEEERDLSKRVCEQIDQNNTEFITPKIQSNNTQILINLNKFPEDTGLKLIKQLQKHIPTIIKAEPENKNVIVTVKATDAEDAVFTIRTMKIQGTKLQCELLNNETIMVEESESSSVVIEVSADDKM